MAFGYQARANGGPALEVLADWWEEHVPGDFGRNIAAELRGRAWGELARRYPPLFFKREPVPITPQRLSDMLRRRFPPERIRAWFNQPSLGGIVRELYDNQRGIARAHERLMPRGLQVTEDPNVEPDRFYIVNMPAPGYHRRG